VADAAEVSPQPQADAVISFGVFLYFRSLPYAESVLDRMVAKARRVVAVFDVPDLATRTLDIERRQQLAGGAAAYEARYADLDHRYYDREWMDRALRARGLTDIHIEDQTISDYGNAPFRFNAWGFSGT
jgi:hypothetical protein